MSSKNVVICFLALGLVILSLVAPAGAVTVYNVDLSAQAGFGNLKQGDVPNCGNGQFACGPTAAVNSFIFLQNKYPAIYDSKLVPDSNGNGFDYPDMVAVATTLGTAAYMDCAACNGGTFVYHPTDPVNGPGFVNGKRKWINEKAPNTTVYGDQFNPSWEWIFNEMNHMEDVEVLFGFYDSAGNRIGGHYVTMTKFNWTDTNMDGIIQAGENAMIGFIDPADGTNKMQSLLSQSAAQYSLTTNYSVGGTIGTPPVTIARTGINWAIKESPIPEPGTIMLLLTAVVAATGYRQTRRAA